MGVDGVLVFNFENDPNFTAVIDQIRLDYADAVGEGVKLKAVTMGRTRLPRNVNSNLYGQSYLTSVGAADIDTNSQIGPVIFLAENGLEAGEHIDYASIEVEATGARGGRIMLRFFQDGISTVLADYPGQWVRNASGFVKSEVRDCRIPEGSNRFAVILEREDAGDGLVGGRRPIVDAADAIVRADVQQGATSNLTIEPYDSGSAQYQLGDQVSSGGQRYIYVSNSGGQTNALANTSVWRRNADLTANSDGVLQGYGNPNPTAGSNGDYYYDLGSNLLYQKVVGIWVLWTPVRRNVGALAANDAATTDLIAFRAVTEQDANSRSNFSLGSASPIQTVSASIPIADEFAGQPVLARVSMIAECLNDSGGPTTTVSMTVGTETIDLSLDLDNVGDTQQFSITRYYTPAAGTFTVTGSVDQSGGSVEMQAFTAEAVMFKR